MPSRADDDTATSSHEQRTQRPATDRTGGSQLEDEEEQVQERMLGKVTYVGIGRGRVVRNKRREGRRYDREAEAGLTEYQEARASTARTA